MVHTYVISYNMDFWSSKYAKEILYVNNKQYPRPFFRHKAKPRFLQMLKEGCFYSDRIDRKPILPLRCCLCILHCSVFYLICKINLSLRSQISQKRFNIQMPTAFSICVTYDIWHVECRSLGRALTYFWWVRGGFTVS